MRKCPRCSQDSLRINFMLGVSAPASLEGRFSKSSMKSKDVWTTHATWDSCTSICTNEKCLWTDNGYSNWIDQTVKERDELLEYKENREKLLEDLYDFIQIPREHLNYKTRLKNLYIELNNLGYGKVNR